MSAIEQLKMMSKITYHDDEGDSFRIKLKAGMSAAEIETHKQNSPKQTLSKEVEELLKFSRGFETTGGFLDEVRFDSFESIFFDELIQHNLNLTHDGLGGCWIQEIKATGEWDKIYLAGHDPAVLIKQADNLHEFLCQLHEYFSHGQQSFFLEVYEKIAFDIYAGKGRLLEQSEALQSGDKILAGFASQYTDEWFIADLRHAKNGEGFRLEASFKETIRLEDELIWALKKLKSFWTKLGERFTI